MDKIEQITLLLTSSLPIAALATFTLATPAWATCGSNQCTYASQCYDPGACVSNACESGKGQKCSSSGWSTCGEC